MDDNELAHNEVNGKEPPPSGKTINSSLNGSPAVIMNVVPSTNDSAAPTSHGSATMMFASQIYTNLYEFYKVFGPCFTVGICKFAFEMQFAVKQGQGACFTVSGIL